MGIVLNFGPGPYSGADPDQTVEIPISASLPEFSTGIDRYQFLRVNRDEFRPSKSNRDYERVRLHFLPTASYFYQQEIWLLWIPERTEWVAIQYDRWREDSLRFDELYKGPYSLDSFTESKLCLAFEIPPLSSLRCVARRTAPNYIRSLLDTAVPDADLNTRYFDSEPPSPMSSKAPLASHVFLSYVKEDTEQAVALKEQLSDHGYHVWIDRESLQPGMDWRLAIARAICEGMYFIACFSHNYLIRRKTYMNEELQLAVEQLRQMPDDSVWFIPVKFSECDLPVIEIRSGKEIDSKQWVELFPDWQAGVDRLIAGLKGDVTHI